MAFITKKFIAAALAGVFILAGAATLSAEAAGNAKHDRKREINPAKVTERMSELFGVSQLSLLKHHAGGMKFRDLNRAAYLADISGKSLDEIIAMKDADTSWREVGKTLNITKEQRKAERQKLFAARMQIRTGVPKETSLSLIQDGYKLRQVAIAGALAKQSGRPVTEVIKLKTNENKWRDVATTLGVDKDTFSKSLKQAKSMMRHGHHGKMRR